MRWFVSIAVLIVSLSSFMSAQQDGSGKPKGSHRYSFIAPAGVPSEAIQIQYYMSGSFGGYDSALNQQPGLTAYELDAGTATHLKVIAYMPGCSMVTLDLTPEMPATQSLVCRPLPLVSLVGQVVPMDVLKGKRAEVEVTYGATWAHVFFGISDGIETTFRVANVTPDEAGAFTVSLPDFTQDAISYRWKENGGWRFLLREVETGNILTTLKPSDLQSSGTTLPVQSAYPEVVNFKAESW